MAGTGAATLDFGTGSNEAEVVVSGESGILGTSKADAWTQRLLAQIKAEQDDEEELLLLI